MGNMGYCKFENTILDLRDCRMTLGDLINPLSRSELSAAKSLTGECLTILQDLAEKAGKNLEDMEEEDFHTVVDELNNKVGKDCDYDDHT